MQLKQSDYNYLYDDLGQDQIVFYNSRTGALAVVHAAQYRQFQEFVRTGAEIEDREFLAKLTQCGFLLPAGVDERFLIRTSLMLGRYQSSVLSLTIAPTMACNFRCIYCFEQGHYGSRLMDEATQEHLLEFVQTQLAGVAYLSVTWFGGEPLLGMPVIERLSRELLALCERNQIRYSASIITNGFLYTRAAAEALKAYHVRSVQITVDGPKEIHDARRPMKNGQGTYDTILANLVETKGILPVHLRINVDYDNAAAADRVMDALRENGLLETTHPYLGLVIPQNTVYGAERCLSDEQYSKINLEFLLRHHIPLRSVYPRPKRNLCVADARNGWVIDDTGALYKCLNDIGLPEKSVGDLKLGRAFLQRTDRIAAYSAFDPTASAECGRCKMLPVCMGGCPSRRLAGNPVCEQRKFGIQEYLICCTQALLAQASPAVRASRQS